MTVVERLEDLCVLGPCGEVTELLQESFPELAELGAAAERRGRSPEFVSALAPYLAWLQDYHAGRRVLLRSRTLMVVSFALAAWVLLQGVLPTFVTLFEGMSLRLPWPSQALIWLCHHGWRLVGSVLLAVAVVPKYWGYSTWWIGPVLRSLDRAHYTQALRLSLAAQALDPWRAALELIPPRSRRRLQGQFLEIPIQEDALERLCQQSRERLTRRWSALLGALATAVLVTAALLAAFMGLALSMPFYTISGNLG